jgi:hypothetical protein
VWIRLFRFYSVQYRIDKKGGGQAYVMRKWT